MSRRARLSACLLALLVLPGCGASVSTEPAPVTEGSSVGTLAYVPLDDRPVNDDRVVYLAESLGYRILLPDWILYHTSLDGQARNPNGAAYGDRAALYEWVLAQEAAGCDRYILSLDQLLSGGLVNSRSFSGGDIVLSDGTALSEKDLINGLLSTLGEDVQNQVYLLDTVMRLAPTVGYDGWDLAGYEALRSYGMRARPSLEGAALTLESIAGCYGLDENGKPIDPADYGVSAGEAARYHDCRARKLRLIDYALTASDGMDNVRFLIGVDDSAPSESIQTNEIAYLKRAVEGRGAVLSGADEDGMLAVCRLYGSEDPAAPLPRVRVRYFGSDGDIPSSDFDHQPLREIVSAHLDYLGAEETEGDADLQLLVLTRPAEDSGRFRGEAVRSLIAALRENEEACTPTVLIDAARNRYGGDFQAELVEKTDLAMLLGYAGYYDLANASGVALANGVARWLCLNRQGVCSTAQNQAYLRTLADSLIKDICYKNQAKDQLSAWVRETLGGDPDNFARTGTDPARVRAELESLMEQSTAGVLENLSSGWFLASLDGTRLKLNGLTVEDYAFPWQRVFEIRTRIALGDFLQEKAQ